MSEPLSHNREDNALFAQIKNVLDETRRQVARSVNTTIVKAYWQVGKYIVEYEQQGKGYSVSSQLTWTHWRALLRVQNEVAREYYIQICRQIYDLSADARGDSSTAM